MTRDVVVRFTPAQLGAVRSIVAITVECGEGDQALANALRSIDDPKPVLTKAEWSAFLSALVAYDGDTMDAPRAAEAAALNRAHTKFRVVKP